MRNLDGYTMEYLDLPFERVLESYRRSAVINYIRDTNSKRILEVGCGVNPIFTSLDPALKVTVVEPSRELFDIALFKSKGYGNSSVINTVLEDFESSSEFDLIILSSILHEVVDKKKFMEKILYLCGEDTKIYINVPNAKSIHRLLAVCMGLIEDVFQISDTQLKMQQLSKPFTEESLSNFIQNCGFQVIDSGTIFIKPFTHVQMQSLIDSAFLNEDILNGLNKLALYLPEFGSEIWMSAKRN